MTVRPGGVVLTTPAALELTRAEVKTLFFELEGYDSGRVYLDRLPDGWGFLGPYAANLVLGGIIGMVIDLSNQDVLMYELDPRPIHWVLKPTVRIREPDPLSTDDLEEAFP